LEGKGDAGEEVGDLDAMEAAMTGEQAAEGTAAEQVQQA
jgi:hypothetical protein